MHIKLFLIGLILTFNVHAQNWEWVKTLHAFGSQNVGFSIGTDAADNSYVVGLSTYYTGQGSNFVDQPFFYKLDSNGTLLWLKNLPSSLGKSITDLNGNTYLTTPLFLEKYDTDGGLLWSNSYEKYAFRNLTFNPVLGLIAVGSQPGKSNSESVICAISTNGTKLWERVHDFDGYINIVTCDNVGNTYVVSENTIKKLNTQGQEISSFSVTVAPSDIKVNSEDDIILCEGHLINANKNENLLSMLKVNASGIKIWQKNFTGGSLLPGALNIDKYDNIYLAANFSGSLDLGTSKITGAGSEMLFLQFDKDGNLNWFKSTNGSGGTKVRSFVINSKLELFFTGDYGGSKSWGVNTFTLTPDFSDVCTGKLSPVNAVGMIDNEIISSLFKIVPSPGNGRFEVQGTFPKETNVTLNIYDLQGRLFSSYSETKFKGNYSRSFDLSESPKGLYFIEIFTNEAKFTKKLVIN